MTRVVIKRLVWDAYNIEHIKKHKVTIQEVETAIKQFVAHKKAKKGKYMILGRSGGRILAIIVGREKQSVYYVASVRDADKKERQIVYEKEK